MRKQTGIALITVLWVMVLLFIIASQFVQTMKAEISITRNQKEDLEAYYLAKAGIHLAIFEIIQDTAYHYNGGDDGTIIFGENPKIPRKDVTLGNGSISYSIVDEESKLNINNGSKRALSSFFTQIGLNGQAVTDSILDWIDEDDLYHTEGAEDSYYLNFSNPYESKDGPFSTVSELLLVKNIPVALFSGNSIGDKKISDLITVSQSGINKNTASEIILRSIFKETQAQKIIEARNSGNGIYSKESTSRTFTVIAEGMIENSPIKRRIKAIIKKINSGEYIGVRIEYWDDNFL